MRDCVCSWFCDKHAVLCDFSSSAIIDKEERELVALL